MMLALIYYFFFALANIQSIRDQPQELRQQKNEVPVGLGTEELHEEKKAWVRTPETKVEHPKTEAKTWGYKDSKDVYGPSHWKELYPKCGGSKQSPVALDSAKSSAPPEKYPPLELVTNDNGMLNGKVTNTGHSFGMELNPIKTVVKLTGGPLHGMTYLLKQFHFHFSCDYKHSGSEHAIDGYKTKGEAHFVFYNTKYESFDKAMDHPDGLVVLGFLVRPSYIALPNTFPLNKYIKDILTEGSSVVVNPPIYINDIFGNLLDKLESLKYFTYEGSLTTPPCSETVRWIVFVDPIRYDHFDINRWKLLMGEHGRMCNNYRPIQPLNHRTVTFVKTN